MEGLERGVHTCLRGGSQHCIRHSKCRHHDDLPHRLWRMRLCLSMRQGLRLLQSLRLLRLLRRLLLLLWL